MFSYAMQFYIVFIFVTYLMLDSYFSNSMSLTMAKSGSVRLGTYNPSARHQHSKSTKNGFVLCLVGFCFVLLVVSACLLAALILIGKHLSNKNEKLWAVDSVSYDNNITESDFAISRRIFDINDTDPNVDTVQNDETIHEIHPKFYRLSNSVRPIHYNLYLFPNLNTSEFIGNVTIEIELAEPTDSISVHGKSIDLINVILFDANGTSYTVESVTENRITELWSVVMNATLDPGVYNLGIEFTGDMKNKRIGLYSSEYYDPDTNERRSIATSKFEPTYARQSFPCFDEPNLKAEYTVTLVKPNKTEYIALSNMNVDMMSTERLLKQNKNEDSVPIVFKKSVRMSTYLSCFIICDFQSKSDVVHPPEGLGLPLKFSVYATPAQKEKTTFALKTGMSVILHYINYFQMDFPLPKLDMVAIPDFPSGAMETWGLVTFRETALLFDNKTNSVLNQQRVATVIAHELAHSWFGNLVTMDWWNDLWLNEGFATYIEYDGVHSVYNDWGMRDQFLINELHTAFDVDGSLSSHPIVQKVENPDEITAIFDTISYSKGSSVLRMLDNMVGNDVFKKGITAYLKKFKFQNAKTQDLFDAIQNISNKINITDVMDTWTRQMGYPEVLVKKEKDSTYILTQNRFLIDKDADGKKEVPSEYNYRWTIPITYISDRSQPPVQVMFDKNASELRINVTATWIKFNAEQVGYYRVNYEPELWKALESNFKKLSVADRTSLLNDAFNLAKAGRLPYATAFSLSQRLIDDKDYVTWSVGSREFMNLKKLLYTTDVYSSLRKYVTELATENYEQLTWKVNDTDAHLKRLLRITTLDIACSFDHIQCSEEVGKTFVSWLTKPGTDLHPDIRSLVYSHGMKSAGTAVLWKKLWERFITESDASEKLKLMNGLASAKDPWLLSRFIDLAWDVSNVRRQDYFTCLQYISANPVGTPLVWDHVRENWQMLVDEFTLNDRYLGRLIPSITSTFNTEIKLQEMMDFFEKYPDAGAGKSARAQALETVRNNIKWLKNYKEDVKYWLKNREKTHFTTTSV